MPAGRAALMHVYRSDGTFVRQLNVGSDTGGVAVNPAGTVFVGGAHGVDVFRADGSPRGSGVAMGHDVSYALITGHLARLIKKTSATFTFTSSNIPPAATFRCRLTKYLERPKAFKACPSPITYPGLVHDLYTFQVQAITSSGFVQLSAARYTFAVRP